MEMQFIDPCGPGSRNDAMAALSIDVMTDPLQVGIQLDRMIPPACRHVPPKLLGGTPPGPVG